MAYACMKAHWVPGDSVWQHSSCTPYLPTATPWKPTCLPMLEMQGLEYIFKNTVITQKNIADSWKKIQFNIWFWAPTPKGACFLSPPTSPFIFLHGSFFTVLSKIAWLYNFHYLSTIFVFIPILIIFQKKMSKTKTLHTSVINENEQKMTNMEKM